MNKVYIVLKHKSPAYFGSQTRGGVEVVSVFLGPGNLRRAHEVAKETEDSIQGDLDRLYTDVWVEQHSLEV